MHAGLQTYHVADLEGGLRVCGVRIGSALGQAPYEPAVEPAPMRKIVSLQLTVRIGNREVTRVLGGHDGSGDPSPEDVNEVHGLILGTHMLAFEGPPPSLSTVLDDVLTARLSVEPVDRAAGEGMDLPGILAVLEKGFHVLPGELATLMMRAAPLSGDAFAFSEQGMRCVLYSAHAVMNSVKTAERVDILPVTNTHVISPDSEVLIDKALDASLRLASAEAALFPVNTFSLLEGKALTNFRAALYGQNPISGDQRSEWEAYRRALQDTFAPRGAAAFCASDLSTRASWVLDRETLELYALLPDGSGGGERVQDIERQLLELDRVVSMLNMLPLAAGAASLLNPIGGVALSVVAAYGQNLARLYAAASMSIIMMDASGISPALRLAAASMACSIVKSISLGVFAGAGKVAARAVDIFTLADDLIGATGASSPFSCPV